MAHPHDPYIPTEDDKKYIEREYDKLKKKKKNKFQVKQPVNEVNV